MRRLIYAELFRIIHSGLLIGMIFVAVLFPIVCSFSNPDWKYQTLLENCNAWSSVIPIFMPLGVGSIICASITMAYQNRTAYHEIIDGHSIHEIILSKVVVYSVMMTVSVATVFIAYTGIIVINSGIGGVQNIFLKILMFIIITLHICVASTLISVIVSAVTTSGIFSFVFLILRFFMIDCAVYIMSLYDTSHDNLINWFIMGQFSEIFTKDINPNMISGIVLSLAIETVIWYICAYHSLKRKNFK